MVRDWVQLQAGAGRVGQKISSAATLKRKKYINFFSSAYARPLIPVSSAERDLSTAAAVEAGEDIVDVVGFIGVFFEEGIEARDRGG